MQGFAPKSIKKNTGKAGTKQWYSVQRLVNM